MQYHPTHLQQNKNIHSFIWAGWKAWADLQPVRMPKIVFASEIGFVETPVVVAIPVPTLMI